ncbi:MAG: hypothetical protein RLY13_609, partial [Actinomycetota bacterium]
MTKFSISSKIPALKKDLAVVLGVKEVAKNLKLAKSQNDSSSLNKHDLEHLGASATFESFTKVAAPNSAIFALIGIGADKLDEDKYRTLGGAAIRNLRNIEEVVFDLAGINAKQALALLEGAALGNYEYSGRKTNSKPARLSKITVLCDEKVSAADIARIEILSASVNATRDLVNTPPNELYPASMVKEVQNAIKGLGISATIWD